MSTSLLLYPLYYFRHSSSSPVCSGTFAFIAILPRNPLDTHTIYRLYATWRDHLELFTVFCFTFLYHSVLTIAFFVAAYQRDVDPSSEVYLNRGLEPGCTVPVHLVLVIMTVGLWWCKVIAVCECPHFSILPRTHLTVLLDAPYVMYNYRCTLLSRSQHSSSPTQTKSSTNSLFPSTPVRRLPFLPFKPKSNAFAKSLQHARPWPPTNIPTIKIDLASDQSSASSYSNGLSSTSSAGFGFATKYPLLRTVLLDPIGENLKAALERERKKGKGKETEREREEADLGLVQGGMRVGGTRWLRYRSCPSVQVLGLITGAGHVPLWF